MPYTGKLELQTANTGEVMCNLQGAFVGEVKFYEGTVTSFDRDGQAETHACRQDAFEYLATDYIGQPEYELYPFYPRYAKTRENMHAVYLGYYGFIGEVKDDDGCWETDPVDFPGLKAMFNTFGEAVDHLVDVYLNAADPTPPAS